jgi:hypothetical protein
LWIESQSVSDLIEAIFAMTGVRNTLGEKIMNPVAPTTPRPGIPCPRCQALVEFQIADLLRSTTFRCKVCFLELTLDRTQSRESLEALEKLQGAIEMLNAVKKRYQNGER